MNTKNAFLGMLFLAGLIYCSEGLAQFSKVEWSSFNLGFGAPSSTNTHVCAAIGQSFVGATQNASTQVVSGFLVHPSISGLKTAVEEKTQDENQLPTSYDLEQNYPNPFWSGATSRSAGNPSTTIAFALPKPSEVTLKIFDASGREVATLVEGKLLAGRHQVVLDASPFSSGVYFYRLQAGEFSQTRRLMLVK
ncbi:T9SS type A sorting domain-containing protein [candidate division KSB1 bacterium]|nr:T9SS type A sorting domain-containing protein [candidate division KSB1 bacterium]